MSDPKLENVVMETREQPFPVQNAVIMETREQPFPYFSFIVFEVSEPFLVANQPFGNTSFLGGGIR